MDMWQTQWPDWVYKQYDVHQLVSRITEKLKLLCKAKFLIYINGTMSNLNVAYLIL